MHHIFSGEEALYEEDLTEEEILDELAPLSVQLAFVLGRLGRVPEAIERLEPLVQGELSDPATAAVAANNYVVDTHAIGECFPLLLLLLWQCTVDQ